jgi:predicted house-cleaning noncanonical NTP pyrophosphatase (MazG superfamily)
MSFGKLVRDKIPARISQRQEADITRQVPSELVKGFLTGKLLEEALEVRNAQGQEQKSIELADLYEVVRALAHAEGIPLDEVIAKADEKRSIAGGFEERLVLLQTAIIGRDRTKAVVDRSLTQVLARKTSDDTYEIPFVFFGFMDLDQPRSLMFEELGVRLDVSLKGDRIELRLSREAEQLNLPLDLVIDPDEDTEAVKPLDAK